MTAPSTVSLHLAAGSKAESRFLAKVDLDGPGGCWLWAGGINAGGYGQFHLEGGKRYAHRVAYETLVGPIPKGLTIDHACHVRNCVNPVHLRPATVTQQRCNLSGPQENNKSGTLGVSWYKPLGKWYAQIQVDGHKINLGYFVHLHDAIAARRAAEIKYGFTVQPV